MADMASPGSRLSNAPLFFLIADWLVICDGMYGMFMVWFEDGGWLVGMIGNIVVV